MTFEQEITCMTTSESLRLDEIVALVTIIFFRSPSKGVLQPRTTV